MTSDFSYRVIKLDFCIGIAVDKQLKNNIKVPLTSFYFWPRINGWKLLKHELELKPWLTQEEKIKILNGYTRIIANWNWSNNLKTKNSLSFNDLENKDEPTIIGID